MWFVVSVLTLLCIALGAGLFFSLRLNLQNADKIEEIRGRVEQSLDVLDTFYQRAVSRAELEIMLDEPVVRELVADLKASRDAILLVANLIIDPLRDDEEDTEL